MRASRTVRNLHSRVNGCIEQHAGPFAQGHKYSAHQVCVSYHALITYNTDA
jgi:hypothetical protein